MSRSSSLIGLGIVSALAVAASAQPEQTPTTPPPPANPPAPAEPAPPADPAPSPSGEAAPPPAPATPAPPAKDAPSVTTTAPAARTLPR